MGLNIIRLLSLCKDIRTHRDTRNVGKQGKDQKKGQQEGGYPQDHKIDLKGEQLCLHLDLGLQAFRTVRK